MKQHVLTNNSLAKTYRLVAAMLMAFICPMLAAASPSKLDAKNIVVSIEIGGDTKSKAAGIMVGQDDDWIYIATAKHVVVADGEQNQNIRVLQNARSAQAIVKLDAIDPFADLAVLKVATQAGFEFPLISAVYEKEVPKTIHIVSHKDFDIAGRFETTEPVFDQLDQGDVLGIITDRDLNGYSGGAVFDSEWRLAGLHFQDGVLTDDGATIGEYLTLDYIRLKLTQFNIPLAPHMKGIKEGPLPQSMIWDLPMSNHLLSGDARGFNVLRLTLNWVDERDGTVQVYIFEEKGSDWSLLEQMNVEPKFIQSGSLPIKELVVDKKGPVQGIAICVTGELPNGAYGVATHEFKDVRRDIGSFEFVMQNDPSVWTDRPKMVLSTSGCDDYLSELNSREPEASTQNDLSFKQAIDLMEIPIGIAIGKRANPINRAQVLSKRTLQIMIPDYVPYAAPSTKTKKDHTFFVEVETAEGITVFSGNRSDFQRIGLVYGDTGLASDSVIAIRSCLILSIDDARSVTLNQTHKPGRGSVAANSQALVSNLLTEAFFIVDENDFKWTDPSASDCAFDTSSSSKLKIDYQAKWVPNTSPIESLKNAQTFYEKF